MSRRGPGLAGRLTAPMAWADPALDAYDDWAARHPWVWWPIGPPDQRKPLGLREHGWVLGMSLAGVATVEAVQAANGTRAAGAQLAFERAFTAVVGGVVWLLATGAWERRAARRRRWWRTG